VYLRNVALPSCQCGGAVGSPTDPVVPAEVTWIHWAPGREMGVKATRHDPSEAKCGSRFSPSVCSAVQFVVPSSNLGPYTVHWGKVYMMKLSSEA
jgi:hypothetical protein